MAVALIGTHMSVRRDIVASLKKLTDGGRAIFWLIQ